MSGDMFLGALVDAGVSFKLLEDMVAALDIGARIEVSKVTRSGITATKVDVYANGEKELPREIYWEQQAHKHELQREHKHEHGHEHSHEEHSHRTRSNTVHTHTIDDSRAGAPALHEHSHSHEHQPRAHDSHSHAHGRGLTEIREVIRKAPIS